MGRLIIPTSSNKDESFRMKCLLPNIEVYEKNRPIMAYYKRIDKDYYYFMNKS